MKKPQIPSNERQRLQCLLDYKVLDTAPEKDFDDLTFLAKTICDLPIALISLVDKDRQWFKSKQGLEAPETPRDISFCGHVINSHEMMIINDATSDERFFDNPLVSGAPNIRFYAGAPLVSPEGHPIGTLCVIDFKARELTSFQKETLAALSRQVISLLELRKNNQLLKEQFVELQTLAKNISLHQTQLIHSSQMSTLGEMASAMAHEINNPLAIIAGNLEMTKSLIENSPSNLATIPKLLDSSMRASNRIAVILKGLRTFARDGSKDTPEVVVTEDVIKEVMALVLERFRKNNIALNFEGQISEKVHCRRVQFGQALFNLLTNAYEACLQSSSDPKWVKLEVKHIDKNCLIKVIDSGQGIPKEIQNRMMEPFFSTKFAGTGIGLGLNIAKDLIEANQGQLYYEENAAHTTFVISLLSA